MPVELITKTSDELLKAMDDLIPQLSRSAPPLTESQLRDFVDQDSVYLFVYRSETDGAISGMLSLATFFIPTGGRGWVEDVVVDQAARGQGAGEALVKAALDKAREIGLKTVDLTSRPHREAANRLYVRCGFEPRETNIYRYQV
ncbi:GNAT family N-acetyltransferase [Actinomycetaceae bacterium MB13-C1-2]|nr:GNAT family N-acetyltransferase [Actinomycetaceae bacterium MB13-C1-2]